ncbi:MAG: hypothetical protein ACM65M_17655 [Microcoleus sp.]
MVELSGTTNIRDSISSQVFADILTAAYVQAFLGLAFSLQYQQTLEFDNKDKELSREFFSDMHDMDWLMNVYRVFLINSVFTHLWEVIS